MDLQTHVGAPEEDFVFCQWCEDQATALIANFIGDTEIPEDIMNLATIQLGSEIYHRRNAPNAVAQFAAFGESPVRIARDPMVSVYPLLKPYLPLGFA